MSCRRSTSSSVSSWRRKYVHFYLELQKPLYERRRAIIAGEAKPTTEEITAGIEEAKKDKDDYEAVAVEGDTEAIPEFWLTTLRNHPGITELITDRDADALKSLTDIQIAYLPAGEQAGYKLLFHFKPNDYFTNEVLEKTYLYQAEVGYTGDFIYDKAVGTEINWKADKDLTKTYEIKKQRNKNTNRTRLVRKAKPADSFFNFFSPVLMPSEEEIEKNGMDDDELELIEEQVEMDYQIGEDLKEKIIPRAIDYFTGKALEYEEGFDDDDDDFEDIDDDEDDDDEHYDDDDDSEDDVPARRRGPPKRGAGSENVNPDECKQQ
ncbi:hypothetical protein NM688_g8908 [Phlebia brevispora]|uniref:Uncharacterized protein n=1 Tax=Phlebia brevispora TaxID=194682 RepID=A0ACC1RNM3_9APHY|nr:hypothetical protein NM688_g8908 [Phlebia brevispora]